MREHIEQRGRLSELTPHTAKRQSSGFCTQRSRQVRGLVSRLTSCCLRQVYWNSLSRTYWVHWHMVEILGTNQTEKETQEKATSLTETLRLSAGQSLTWSSTCRTSCRGLTVLSVVLSEPDLLLQAPWRSLLSALPG